MLIFGLLIFFLEFASLLSYVIKALQSECTQLCTVGKDLDKSLATVVKWKIQAVVILQ